MSEFDLISPLPPPTPNQPTLPEEEAFTQAELIFMDESPPGLFPENQDSNFGYIIRKIFSDRAQDIANWQDIIYSERFVETSSMFLDQWELEVGLPPDPPNTTMSQRRANVLARLRRDAFTRTRRREIIESFIQVTFGEPIKLFPEGHELRPEGSPIYGEDAPVTMLYEIYEDIPNFHYIVWVALSNMPSQEDLYRELRRITPAGITFEITYVRPT